MGSPSQPRAKRGGGSVLVRAAGSAGHSKAAENPGEERGGGGQSALQFEALRTKTDHQFSGILACYIDSSSAWLYGQCWAGWGLATTIRTVLDQAD